MSQPLLSICIPTYNRADILRGNISLIQKQLADIDISELEIIVSNNCSTDHTEEVVMSFIKEGIPIIYNRNSENLGADGNFLKVMNMASGKYIYLLGDDDYLLEGSISHLLNCLRGKNYGVLFIDFRNPLDEGIVHEYDNVNEFIRFLGRQLTYMSANIFRRDIVNDVNGRKYIGTCLLQMPFFIRSCLKYEVNAVTKRKILIRDVGATPPPQEYNFLEAFSKNYIDIVEDVLKSSPKIDKDTISFLKKEMYMTYTGKYVYNHLIKKIKIGDNQWQYVWPYYKREWYFYWCIIVCVCGSINRKIKNC